VFSISYLVFVSDGYQKSAEYKEETHPYKQLLANVIDKVPKSADGQGIVVEKYHVCCNGSEASKGREEGFFHCIHLLQLAYCDAQSHRVRFSGFRKFRDRVIQFIVFNFSEAIFEIWSFF